MPKRFFKATTKAGVTAVMSSETRVFALAVIRMDDGCVKTVAFYEGTDNARKNAARAAKAKTWQGPGEVCEAVEVGAVEFKALKEAPYPELAWGDGGHELDEYCDACGDVLEAGQIGECDGCRSG